jgi:hypothetical protein
MRCFFEAMTPLAMAGKVNEESTNTLSEWATILHNTKHSADCKWPKAFHRSCPTIACKAGSLYTFENSIVLVTLNNCAHLTMNLLLMSGKSSRSTSVSDPFASVPF